MSVALVREIAATHRGQRGALLPILHAVQEVLGCVPPEAIPVLADELNLSRADVHGVVSFYHDFRSEPAGRTTVRICRGRPARHSARSDWSATCETDAKYHWGRPTSIGR